MTAPPSTGSGRDPPEPTAERPPEFEKPPLPSAPPAPPPLPEREALPHAHSPSDATTVAVSAPHRAVALPLLMVQVWTPLGYVQTWDTWVENPQSSLGHCAQLVNFSPFK
jgi:hypothetical protein